MRQVFADTETTGMDPKDGHRIVEVALVEVVDSVATGRRLHYYVNPERDIDAEAVAVHGLTREKLADKPKFRDIAEEVSNFLSGADEFLAHNAKFDVKFLDEELGRMRKGSVNSLVKSVVDTLKLAKELYPGKKNSLDALCTRLGVDTSARELHGALLDTELLVEAYVKMTDGVDLSFDPDAPKALGAIQRLPSDRKPLNVIRASAAELSSHSGYLTEMEKESKKTPLFGKPEVLSQEVKQEEKKVAPPQQKFRF